MDTSVSETIEAELVDTDRDRLSDEAERYFRTNPYDADTDNDGLLDGEEVVSTFEVQEAGFGYFNDWHLFKSWRITDPHDIDSDDDGLSDGEEVHLTHTAPSTFDSDADGLSDADEWSRGTNPLNRDTDHDLVSDGQEVNEIGSDPLRPGFDESPYEPDALSSPVEDDPYDVVELDAFADADVA